MGTLRVEVAPATDPTWAHLEGAAAAVATKRVDLVVGVQRRELDRVEDVAAELEALLGRIRIQVMELRRQEEEQQELEARSWAALRRLQEPFE